MWGILLALLTGTAWAWTAEHEGIWDTAKHQWITLDQLAASSNAGDIFVFGEQHATTENATSPSTFIHHDNQVRLLQSLYAAHAAQGATVSTGMEFLTYTLQSAVEDFRAGKIDEATFLKSSQWGMGNPFEFYRRQILFAGGGETVSLNIPSVVAHDVSQLGPKGLTADETKLLPPVWEQGNAGYFARFSDAMMRGGHSMPPTDLQNYFWAQSLWDDTMAWRALTHRTAFPNDILMIVVGAFHVEFGGGLPYELKKLGQSPVKTVLQIETGDWTAATLTAAVVDDPVYGRHADFLWVHSGATP